jgi:Permuted papain-like amidase enzyme, YaeF/YiiX, C92 family
MKRKILYILTSAIFFYLVLLIPTENILEPKVASKKQFVWNRDSLWVTLENEFVKSKLLGCEKLENRIFRSIAFINSLSEEISNQKLTPDDPLFEDIGQAVFATAALVGGCEKHTAEFIESISKIRNVVKKESQEWNLESITARQTLYKVIYGSRAAVEELLLQSKKEKIPELILEENEESVTPSASILGVKIHSGDILVSRGGAPTSALIARGSDYPGNFSHIALAYVDDKTKLPYIIEAHIERGVTISSIYDYLKDKKLRVMVLRLRKDLPQLQIDPKLPHKAARLAYQRAEAGHIPYDFEMNYNNDEKWFCSEVASSTYRNLGVNLWMGVSSISSQGTAEWLAGFGVTHFETHEPSDLEYDPQINVVAEWRNPETLYQDHVDNAIVEALLDEANAGKKLTYDWYMLPFARIMKFYSIIQNKFGEEGNIPEGMSAESGLRHKKYESMFGSIKEKVLVDAAEFEKEKKYTPPYWRLVGFAKKYVKNE